MSQIAVLFKCQVTTQFFNVRQAGVQQGGVVVVVGSVRGSDPMRGSGTVSEQEE